MDWQGQKLSEQLMQYLLLGSATIAFLTGYIMSSYRMMLTIYLIGVVITFLLTVPNWAFFNRHPLEWCEIKNPDVPSSRQLRLRQQQAAKKNAKPQPRSLYEPRFWTNDGWNGGCSVYDHKLLRIPFFF